MVETVKSVDKIPNDKLKTKYLVTYDFDCDKEMFSMPLLTDLKRGDLYSCKCEYSYSSDFTVLAYKIMYCFKGLNPRKMSQY